MKPLVMIAVFGGGLASGVYAQSFESGTRLPVNPVSGSQFEVIEEGSVGSPQVWCAAATYSNDVLGQYAKTELTVISPRGPSVTSPGRKGVVFTTDTTGLDVVPPGDDAAPCRRVGATTRPRRRCTGRRRAAGVGRHQSGGKRPVKLPLLQSLPS